MFHYNIYLLSKIKLSAFDFKTRSGNRRIKSPSDGHGNYYNYLLMKIKFSLYSKILSFLFMKCIVIKSKTV